MSGRHPPGLAVLFFTEMWERFSYYGMRAFLVLYMVAPVPAGGLGFTDARAGMVYGVYTSMVYLLSVPGGWLADRVVGQRQAVLAGGVLILGGHLGLAFPSLPTFYLGLCLVAVGTGLLKPNISTLVGRLYDGADGRRDAGFTIFYMGINLGAFAAPLVCGAWLAESEGVRRWFQERGLPPSAPWHAAFGAAAVGMGIGLAVFLLGVRRLGEVGRPPLRPPSAPSLRRIWALLAAGLVLALALLAVLRPVLSGPDSLARVFDLLLPALSVLVLSGLFLASPDRRKLAVIAILFLSSAIFWGCFEQAGSTLSLFASRHTDRSLFGGEIGATAFQSLNSLFVVALAPVFAALWSRLAKAGREPSTTAKFGAAMLFAGLGFLVLVPASSAAGKGVPAGPQWLLLVYLLHTCGELCLSPVGLSAMTRLAPAKAGGLVMGVWFLATSLGNYLAGRVVGLAGSLPLETFFLRMALIPGAVGVILLLLAAPIRRMLARDPGVTT
jgi:POT family proton-dependent oligopeptide transporter